MTLSRDFKGIWIPKQIWLCSNLNALEKILWAEIDSLFSQEYGGCFASNEYLATFLGVQERRVRDMISNLKKRGLLEQVSFNGRTRVLKALSPPSLDEVAGQSGNKLPGGMAEKCHPEQQEIASQGTPQLYIERKEDNKDDKDNIARTAAPTRKKTSKISYNFEKEEFEDITEKDLQDWKALYPSLDLPKEIRASIEWIKCNPSKTNRRSLWRKYLNTWFSNATEKKLKAELYKQKFTPTAETENPNRRQNQNTFNALKNKIPQNFKSIRVSKMGISSEGGLDVDWDAQPSHFEQVLAKMTNTRYYAN